jgi:hypothetical protein
MKKQKTATWLFVFFFLYSALAIAGDYEIKFGLMKKDSSGKYYVYSETTTIPLIYKDKDPEFRFGYFIKTADTQAFTTYMIMHTPSAFEAYSGEFKDVNKKDSGNTVQLPSKKTVGWFAQSFRFDRGDPPGQYKIDIWINDKLVRTIDFTVIEAK